MKSAAKHLSAPPKLLIRAARWGSAGWHGRSSGFRPDPSRASRDPAVTRTGRGSYGFRNAKRRAQWSIMLETCAAPLRDKPLDAIRTDSVLAVLAPNLADKEHDRRARRPCSCAGGSNACSTPPSITVAVYV